MWSSYVLAHYKEPHGPLGSEDGALHAAGPNEPYEPPDSRTPSEAPFARHKPYLHFSVRTIDVYMLLLFKQKIKNCVF